MDQKAEFALRLARIRSGALHTNRTLYVGLDQAYQMPSLQAVRALGVAQAPREDPPGFGMSALTMLCLAPLAVLTVRFSGLGLWGPALSSGPAAQGVELGLSLAFALVLAVVLGLRSFGAVGVLLGAVMLCSAGMHNLVHLAPALFQQAFPPDWITAILAQTRPATLIAGGAVLSLPL